MLLAAVIACLGSFSVATAADYTVNSADEFVTAWNQAAASKPEIAYFEVFHEPGPSRCRRSR